MRTENEINDFLITPQTQKRHCPFPEPDDFGTKKWKEMAILFEQPAGSDYRPHKKLTEDDYLFPTDKDDHLKANTVYQMFQKIAGLLDRQDIATLMVIFGKQLIKITKRYIGINDDEISSTLKIAIYSRKKSHGMRLFLLRTIR